MHQGTCLVQQGRCSCLPPGSQADRLLRLGVAHAVPPSAGHRSSVSLRHAVVAGVSAELEGCEALKESCGAAASTLCCRTHPFPAGMQSLCQVRTCTYSLQSCCRCCPASPRALVPVARVPRPCSQLKKLSMPAAPPFSVQPLRHRCRPAQPARPQQRHWHVLGMLRLHAAHLWPGGSPVPVRSTSGHAAPPWQLRALQHVAACAFMEHVHCISTLPACPCSPAQSEVGAGRDWQGPSRRVRPLCAVQGPGGRLEAAQRCVMH